MDSLVDLHHFCDDHSFERFSELPAMDDLLRFFESPVERHEEVPFSNDTDLQSVRSRGKNEETEAPPSPSVMCHFIELGESDDSSVEPLSPESDATPPSINGRKRALSSDYESFGEDPQSDSKKKKTRQFLPAEAKKMLHSWLSQHVSKPFPTDSDKGELMGLTGLTMNQINNWFTNARRRVVPKLKLQIEAAGGAVTASTEAKPQLHTTQAKDVLC